MNRITISIIVIVVILLGIYVPDWVNQNTLITPDNEDESWQPNYQASGMKSTLYNNDGHINHIVYAEKMEHYALLGFTTLMQPEYTIYVEGQTNPWEVAAEEGTLTEDNLIKLEKNVVITTLSENGFLQTINTEYIEINLDNKTMQSDQPIKITGQNFVINSLGFEGNLNNRYYELFDHVETEYSALP